MFDALSGTWDGASTPTVTWTNTGSNSPSGCQTLSAWGTGAFGAFDVTLFDPKTSKAYAVGEFTDGLSVGPSVGGWDKSDPATGLALSGVPGQACIPSNQTYDVRVEATECTGGMFGQACMSTDAVLAFDSAFLPGALQCEMSGVAMTGAFPTTPLVIGQVTWTGATQVPSATVSSSPGTCGGNGNATVTAAGCGPFTYAWTDGVGKPLSPQPAGDFASDLAPGSYAVLATDALGVTTAAVPFQVAGPSLALDLGPDQVAENHTGDCIGVPLLPGATYAWDRVRRVGKSTLTAVSPVSTASRICAYHSRTTTAFEVSDAYTLTVTCGSANVTDSVTFDILPSGPKAGSLFEKYCCPADALIDDK